MFILLLQGCILMLSTMIMQVVFVVLMVRYILRMINSKEWDTGSFGFDVFVICVVLIGLAIGHVLQVAMWATLFIYLGEFDDFLTAFYHSTVNFTSLGYGDIVMSEGRRLLGALEAGNGVLMIGLSTGTMLAVMNRLFSHHIAKDLMQGKAD